MEKTKIKLKHPVLLILSLIACLVSLGFAVVGGRVSRGLTAEPVDLNSLTPEFVYDGEIVAGQVFGSLGSFGVQYKLDEKGNIISEDEYDAYFLVPVNNDYSIVIVTDDSGLMSSLDVLTEATDKFRDGETDSIEADAFDHSGMLVSLTRDELSHLYVWALQNTLFGAETADEVAANIIPYKICAYNRNGALPFLIGGCAGFLIFGIACVALVKNKIEVDEDGIEIEKDEKESE